MAYINHLPLGTILKQQYQIERQLSSGGFGITYLARHTLITEKQFVIKEFFLLGVCIRVSGATVTPETAKTSQFELYKGKFLDEARTIARLPEDPHLVKVVDFFYEHNTAYMVMSYIQGVDLERFVQTQPQQRLPERDALDAVRQAAVGLRLAHHQKILHRDIKPANLMRQPNGQIVIIDFGAARDFIAQDMVQTMTPIYTPGYAPLEQYSSKGLRGDYTDIYALGATLYRLLTGQKPLDALTRLHAPLSAPRSLNPDISENTNALVLKMMAQHSQDRFQTIQAFLNALDAPIGTESDGEIEIELEALTVPERVVPSRKAPSSTPSNPKNPEPKATEPNVSKMKVALILGVVGFAVFLLMWNVQSPEPTVSTTVAPIAAAPAKPAAAPPKAAAQQAFEPEMVAVEGGTFKMGSDDGESDEKPIHSVKLSNYSMGKYEVTVGEFRAFISETSYKTDAEKEGDSYVYENNSLNKKKGVTWRCDIAGSVRSASEDTHPVIHVSWNDAVAYCKWLSSKTGKRYALPTEAQWEYAARGGRNSKGSKYSGSNDVSAVAWHSDNSGSKTHPVGGRAANELDLHDMSGNVWEWCSDWKGDYSSAAVTNPTGAVTGAIRVMRGGSWNNTASLARLANRVNDSPAYRRNFLGFRVVLLPL